jgi:site-specific recombinase XerD
MDVHNYDERLKKAIENVGRCDLISPGNRELMLKFIEYKRAQGTSAGRCAKTLWTIKQFATGQYEKRGHRARDSNTMKDFGLLTKDDVQRTFAALEASALKETTKRDFKILVRFFVGWVFHEATGSEEAYSPKLHDYPSIFNGIHVKEPREVVKPSDLLSDEEKRKMIESARNLRDKALIGCLDEAGMRPGELLGLRIRDVSIGEQCAELSLDGKTGIRSSYIIRNLGYLSQWLDSYDKRGNPEAPLWPDFEKRGQPLSYVGLRQMLKRVAVKAGVTKRVYPYIFRHSQATSDSVDLTEPLMRKLYGWSSSSRTPGRYIHLRGQDAKLAKLKQAGIAVEEEGERVRLCPRCKKPVPFGATVCYSCNSVLTVREALRIQEQREKAMEELKSQVQGLEKENKETRSLMAGLWIALRSFGREIKTVEELDEALLRLPGTAEELDEVLSEALSLPDLLKKI